VADGGGAQPGSARERGLPVAGGGGPGAGSGGEARALERRSRRGVGMGEQVEQRERGASGSTAARQREKGREKVGVPGVGVPRDARVLWGLAPTGRRRPAADRARREGADGWAAAQCRAAVPLTGGLAYQRARWRARARVGRPAKKAGWPNPDEQ
jgi:hypothetical protein